MSNLKSHSEPSVLLVDDAPLILDLLQEILEDSGYRVLRSETGTDVPGILAQEQVGVVFCDILLPEINGVEVLRQIKQQSAEVQVVIISGQQNFETAREVLRERALDFLVKPFGPGEVLAAVQQGFAAYNAAINQKKARNEAQRRMADLVLLKQVGETASAGNDLQELFAGILDSIVLSAGVEACSLMLADDDNRLRISAARGLSDEIVKSVLVAPGEGISGHVFQMREPVLVQNISFDDRFDSLVGGERYKNQSLLSVPILYRDRALGVINVNNKRSGEAFDAEDENLLMAIAHQVALAIENFKLVTSLRRQTRTLERTNADLVKLNLARTRLVCNLSHELKTPLTSIMGFVDLALTFYERLSEEDLKDYLGQAREEGVRLEGLITSMLRLFSIESEREPWNWKAFNLGWSISEAFQYFGKRIERARLKVEVEIAEDLPDSYGDPEKFGIALNALLDNAVKFNREEGRISIHAENRVVDGLEYAYLQIRNDGVTIPPEAKTTIFDSYTQLGDINTEKPHGVGVGLSLVRVVVEKMKGRVILEDKDGEGASFGLLLPSEETYGALRD
jgi:signal transduction histidine kinase/DNA-binding response OmpR family regulator